MTQISEESVGGVTVLHMAGSLTLAGLVDADARFGALARSRATRVVVDISGVDAMSTPAITLVLKTARAIEQRGGSIVFAGPSPHVRRVLAYCRLDLVLKLADDVDAAIRALQDGAHGLASPFFPPRPAGAGSAEARWPRC
jgi:anti-anti-sigma factor